MTVSTTTLRNDYTGNGVTTAFTIGFRFLDNAHIKVIRTVISTGVSSTLAITTDYTVAGAGGASGGTLTMLIAPTSDHRISILRNVPLTQLTDYVANDAFPAESHETALDKLTMIDQQYQEQVDRSFKYPENEAGSPSEFVPSLETRRNKVWYWDANGEPTVGDLSAVAVTFSPQTQTFSGDGATVAFTLSGAPGSSAGLIVSIGGVAQRPGVDFSVANTTLTFTTAPVTGSDNILVQNFSMSRTVNSMDANAVAWDGAFADEVLAQAKPLANYIALRAYTGSATGVRLTDAGISGTFKRRGGAQADNGGTYIVDASARVWERDFDGPASSMWFMSSAQVADIRAGTQLVDCTTALQAFLDACDSGWIADGKYKITDELVLRSNQTIFMSSKVEIRQYTANKRIFKATSKDSVWVHCGGAVLYGEGSWSAAWTGNSGHTDRAIGFIGCTNSGATFPHTKNCASAGVEIVGGSSIKIAYPIIEGTNLYSAPIPANGNFQNGVYISNDSTYGAADDVQIICPDISGVAQGILKEAQLGVAVSNQATQIVSADIHDITGQHAFYMQAGNVAIVNPIVTNVNLSAVKVQSADANLDVSGISATGVIAQNIGNSLFEIATVGTGSLGDLTLSGNANGYGYGLSINGKVTDLRCDLNLRTGGTAVYIQGANVTECDIDVYAKDMTSDGILVTATTSSGIRIHPVLREPCSTAAVGEAGIRIASASASVELFDPDVTDANTKMSYGLFNSVAGSTVKVRGSAKFTGASDTAVRATGVITEWPTEATLSGTNGDYTSLANISSSGPIVTKVNSTSAANVVLWTQNLDDESAYLVKAEISGKLSTSAERAGYVVTGLFYRDAAGVATIQGAVDVDVAIASAGFAGVYALGVDGGNGVVITVNSGGVATYNWKARVTVTKVT